MTVALQTVYLPPIYAVGRRRQSNLPGIRSTRHLLPAFPSRCRYPVTVPLTIRACQRHDQGGGHGSEPAKFPGPDKGFWAKPLLNFASNNFLPLALVSGVTLGLLNPGLGCLADRYYFSKFSTFAIFVISGLAIFCCMPTTLSSGVALTQLAGGNSALALSMTVISNLLGILMIPFSISRFIATGVGVSVPTKQLFKSLVLTLLVPLIIGKVLRESFKSLADFVDGNRKLFSNMSALFLSLVPFMQVSRSRSLLLMVKPTVFLVAIGMGALLHLILLTMNALAIQGFSAVSTGNQSLLSKKQNEVAYILVASQKTLPVMVAVVEKLGGAFGESGLLVLPCVAAHLIQIVMDSFLVNFWFRKDIMAAKAKAA